MFTGLIEDVGDVLVADRAGTGMTLRIATPLARELRAGDSISVSGVCLTAVDPGPDAFRADVSPATFAATTLGRVMPGTRAFEHIMDDRPPPPRRGADRGWSIRWSRMRWRAARP